MARLGESQGKASIADVEPGQEGLPRLLRRRRHQRRGGEKVEELSSQRGSRRCRCPGMGWFAICRDPHGNEFGIWQNDESAQMPEQ